ncbi:MAG: hypothetical protein WB698_11145 [Solirubrobacteraceae bacterium]
MFGNRCGSGRVLVRWTMAAALSACVLLLVSASAAAATPTLEEELAAAGATTATFKATLKPNGETTKCELQYVSQTQYESTQYAGVTPVPCSPATVNGASSGEPVSVTVVDLKVDTRYHFRFVLSDGSGPTDTPDQTFGTFGIESFGSELLGEGLEPYTQAGGHPYELNTTIAFNTTPYLTYSSPDGALKDVEVNLPPGLVGDPSATAAKCGRLESERFQCPADAQVGIMKLTVGEVEGTPQKNETFTKPIYNLVPPPGVAAEFGVRFNNQANAFIEAKLRTGEDYGVNADSLNVTNIASVISASVTMWGVPGSEKHNAERYCLESKIGASYHVPPCKEGEKPEPQTPFLTAPTSCVGPLATRLAVDSYQNPGEFLSATSQTAGMTGCERLHFNPTLEVAPEPSSADSPAGLKVQLHVPQNDSPTELAEADLKDATVTLPAGMTVNPSAASGLVGCPLLHGGDSVSHAGESGIDLESTEPAKCPGGSNIGSVELETPLYPEIVFHGAIYLAQQGNAGAAYGSNPFGSLLAIYLAIDEPTTGVVVKLAGHVVANQATGQLTTTFEENPQLPFENLRLNFTGGERAALVTPKSCGDYEVESVLEPWSHQGAEGESGTPDATPSAPFAITSGAGGAACGSPAFAPLLQAGTANNSAGGFGAFTMILQRKDGEQRFGTVSMTMPKGLAAILAGVPLCGEAQANVGSCPSGSQIGHVVTQAGAGGSPLTLPQPGGREDPVYLTGPYEGAPFGLSIVVHPEAGPFNLANHAGTPQEEPVVVRAKIEVNPSTAQVTIVSNPLPTILQGIPVDVKAVEVTVDRPDFTFNATSCEPMSVTGSIGSAEGASAAVSSRYQAAHCSDLTFKPGFKVTTEATHTRRFGADLRVNVTSGAGQANIKSVFVELPKIMPARAETLKMACPAAQFTANPASCPASSYVGTATAHTPVLATPLSGPALFVSHGGAAFPDLDVVLQGEGVTVVLTGVTNIVKGITSSSFAAVPDVPISSFELALPTGPYSALAGTASFCTEMVTKRVKIKAHGKTIWRRHTIKRKRTLLMPTTITGQNGDVIKENTAIAVEGCLKPKTAH